MKANNEVLHFNTVGEKGIYDGKVRDRRTALSLRHRRAFRQHFPQAAAA